MAFMTFRASSLTRVLLLLLGLAFPALPSASAQFSPQACAGFILLGFEFENYAQYPVWFDENSTMVLAQTGTYRGPEEIEEYVKFANIDSPYVKDATEVNSTANVVGFDPVSGTCTFLVFSLTEYVLDPTTTPGQSVNIAVMAKFFYSIPRNMINDVYIYYTTDFLSWFFGTALNTPLTRSYVCNVLASDGCDEIYTLNGSPTSESCVGELESLTPSEGEFLYVDGLTQGCRSLHATFAQENPTHCAHISFQPAQDPKGFIKCQSSENIPVASLFAAQEEAAFKQFCSEQEELDFSPQCFFVLEEATPTDGPTMSPMAEPTLTDGPTMSPVAEPSGTVGTPGLSIILLVLSMFLSGGTTGAFFDAW